ncbi:MAG: preprotein translocase subunit YajC [Chloroflexi bacterium]|nr:preprotein translocase subunit YajC [Chloroflexota bacterium]
MREFWISAIIIVILFYVFVLLPQQLESRKRKKELAQLRVGDTVVTAGGLIGVISTVEANQVALDIAPGVTVKVVRSAISHRLGQAAVSALK